jgi:DnaK suppressor protein
MIEDDSLNKFKDQLLNLQQELLDLEDTANDAVKTVELDQTRVGRLSRMDALQGQAMSLEAKRRRQIELQKIAAALRRIDKHEYGDCVRCGEPIAVKRLELDPAAPLCITCASEADNNG